MRIIWQILSSIFILPPSRLNCVSQDDSFENNKRGNGHDDEDDKNQEGAKCTHCKFYRGVVRAREIHPNLEWVMNYLVTYTAASGSKSRLTFCIKVIYRPMREKIEEIRSHQVPPFIFWKAKKDKKIIGNVTDVPMRCNAEWSVGEWLTRLLGGLHPSWSRIRLAIIWGIPLQPGVLHFFTLSSFFISFAIIFKCPHWDF